MNVSSPTQANLVPRGTYMIKNITKHILCNHTSGDRLKQVEATEWNYVAVPVPSDSLTRLRLRSVRFDFSSVTSVRVLKISLRDEETLA